MLSIIMWDASALVKRYVGEPGVLLVNEAFRKISPSQMFCLPLCGLEVVSILVRKRNDARLSQELFDAAMLEFKSEVLDQPELRTVPWNDALADRSFELIIKHNLNASDGLGLAAALDLQQSLGVSTGEVVLWTSDKRLLRATQAEGVRGFDPEKETIGTLQQLFGE